MWLFRTFVLRFLRREPVRCGVTLAGIALGVAVIVAIRLANGASLRGFETALDTMSGRASLEIVGTGFGVDETKLRDLGWLRGYGAVSPVIEGDVVVRRADEPDPRRGEMMRVLGIDILKDRPIRDYELTEGLAEARAEAADNHTAKAGAKADILNLLLDPQSIVTSEKFATRHGLKVGDRVIFVIGDREHVAVIRGLLRNEGPAKVIDGNFALLDIAAAQWALDRLGRIDRLDVRLHDPSAIDRAEQEIGARLPEGLTVQRPERRGRQVERMLAAFHLNLTALSYIALVVGLFLVYNTVATSVITRREEIGTLRALGVTQGQVVWLFLAEAVALALPGTALGIAVGPRARARRGRADVDDRQRPLHRGRGDATRTRDQRRRRGPARRCAAIGAGRTDAGARGVAGAADGCDARSRPARNALRTRLAARGHTDRAVRCRMVARHVRRHRRAARGRIRIGCCARVRCGGARAVGVVRGSARWRGASSRVSPG